MPTPIPPTSCDGNTVGLWPFTEGSGTTALDICAGHNGSTSNTSWGSGYSGQQALYLNGTDSTVTMPDSGAFNLPAFTIEAYVNRGTGGSRHGDRQQLVRRAQVDYRGDQFVLGFNGDFLEVNAYCFGFEGITSVDVGRWTHIAVTFDGSTLRTYVNGSLDKARPYPNPGCPSRSAGTGPVVVGNNRVDSDYYVGAVQYLRISNIARTSFPNPQATPTPTATSTPTPIPTPTPGLGLTLDSVAAENSVFRGSFFQDSPIDLVIGVNNTSGSSVNTTLSWV